MKSFFLSIALMVFSFVASAQSLSTSDLVGSYTLSGNGGFLVYDLEFNEDGTSNLSQQTLGGVIISCHGRFSLDEVSQDLVTVFKCGNDIMTQKASLAGYSDADLDAGISILVHLKTSNGTDASILMFFKRK